jgi:hypothetical protein
MTDQQTNLQLAFDLRDLVGERLQEEREVIRQETVEAITLAKTVDDIRSSLQRDLAARGQNATDRESKIRYGMLAEQAGDLPNDAVEEVADRINRLNDGEKQWRQLTEAATQVKSVRMTDIVAFFTQPDEFTTEKNLRERAEEELRKLYRDVPVPE